MIEPLHHLKNGSTTFDLWSISINNNILFAHGVNAPPELKFVAAILIGLANLNWCIAHFRISIHAQEESDERHFPSDRFEALAYFWSEQVNFFSQQGPLVVAVKSMGGRIASISTDEWLAAGQISGFIYQGYPCTPLE